MMLNWQNLRPWNGSQHSAFEELCCQLAGYEPVPPGSVFIRKAPPDAGVECYWKLPNGDEWGWQAKFFISPPSAGQWCQLDESVKTAIEKHPRLTAYTVCLPRDRQDPHIDQQKWFMDKWNEHVEKWTGWAKEKGMSVEFKYWGKHEIWERLSREEHRGRIFFWFNKELFSNKWFENRIEESVANAGPRYTPELNVELPIASLFDGLGRTLEFYTRVKVLYGKIRRTYYKARSKSSEEIAKDRFNLLQENIDQLMSIIEGIEKNEVEHIDWSSVAKLASKSIEIAWECIESLKIAEEQEKEKITTPKEHKTYSHREDFKYKQHYLYELTRDFSTIIDLAKGNEARLANIPALLLVGKAGTGKTHLFCDIAKQRVRNNLATLLLLGEHFRNEEPWSQIIRLLGLSCNREELLGALAAVAQAQGSRTLILIDALNEGDGKKLWNKYISGMLMTLSKHPWLGIAVSVRTSYESLVIPEGLVPNSLRREEHHGFTDYEHQATQIFFNYYGIEHPSIPLLIPEFQNPLFLKLFCQGLKNKGLTRIPHGIRGITGIFSFFIKSVDEKLSKPEYLNFDPKSQVVKKAIEKIAEMMAEECCTCLPREDAKAVINAFLPRAEHENSLFSHLISEGIIAEERFRKDDDEWIEGIHFSYERFTYHLISRYLLDRYLDSKTPSDSFLPDQPLGSYIKDEWACYRNSGLIFAFSVQIPERIKKELAEIAPECANFRPIREAFIESLIWRDPKAITDNTLEYINEYFIRYSDTGEQFLNTLLTVASNPEHPYNADFLHKNLMRFEIAKRDSWWSIFLHNQYGEHRAVESFIDWAWSAENKSHIDDESIRLCGIALAWFLTTSNRYLRDSATKALVCLLSNRIHVLRQIIIQFPDVNDAYVLERLFAVAYGCAMRSMDNDSISELAKDIYEWIFKNSMPPPNILLRDYARGVIELALHRGIDLHIDLKKIRPPYNSEWPSEIPTEKELKKYGKWQKDMQDEEWARISIYSSVMGSGDFARYIIGTNWGLFEWSPRRLSDPKKPSRKEMYETFIQSLTNRQKKAWECYYNIRKNVDIIRLLDKTERTDILKYEFTDEELNGDITCSEQSFRKTLGKKKLKIFAEYVLPYLKDPDPYKNEYRFDLSIAQRWILKKVFDLGWTVKRFGRFDRNLTLYSHHGRSAIKPERIGKKYQWIAYHEFLARVSDNFEFRGELGSDQPKKYEGPWQISYVRKIDPSFLLRKTEREKWQPHTNTWWFPSQYDAWDCEPDDIKWLKNSKDLPDIKPLIEVIKPDDRSRWLILEGFYEWEQPTPPEEERLEIPRREIWYILRSYIVKKSNMDELFEWVKEQNSRGRRMPESRHLISVFLGEFYWSPAYKYFSSPYYDYEEWTRGLDNNIPKEVLVTEEQYLWERGSYDCSIDDSINIYLPAKWLADHMGLRWNGVEGQFYNDKGHLIAFDPSIMTPGPGALLINWEVFIKFLNDNGYDVLWTILGEKNIIGSRMAAEDWKGRLKINGAYRIRENKVEGVINTKFSPRDRGSPSCRS